MEPTTDPNYVADVADEENWVEPGRASGTRASARRSDTAALSLKDPEFLARLRASDRAAIEIVVETYLAQILRAARGAGVDPQQAEDVTQATFTTFIETAPRFEGRSSVRTWLFGILLQEDRRGAPGDPARPADG